MLESSNSLKTTQDNLNSPLILYQAETTKYHIRLLLILLTLSVYDLFRPIHTEYLSKLYSLLASLMIFLLALNLTFHSPGDIAYSVTM